MIQLDRRELVGSVVTLVCAPAIVRVSSLMKVKPWIETADWQYVRYLLPEAYYFRAEAFFADRYIGHYREDGI